MSKLVLTLPALYKDNSLGKDRLKKKIIDQRVASLEKKLEKTVKSRRILSQIIEHEVRKVESIEKAQKEIIHRNKELETMNNAARLIQIKRKELIVKQEIEDSKVTEIEERMQEKLKNLDELTEFVFWNLGNAAENASNLIKRAYQRSKFRQKIDRIRKVYKIVTKNKKTLCRMTIRRGMRVFSCKTLLIEALNSKHLREIQEKCKVIRARLALLSIKSFWKANRITFRKFLYKCKKFKRSVTNSNRFLSADFLNSDFSSYVSTPGNEFVNQVSFKDSAAAHLAAIKLEQEREERLNNTLISYNIKKFREKKIPPLNLTSIEEDKPKVFGFRERLRSKIGISSKTIEESTGGKSHRSIGTVSTRSASNNKKIFRYI